MPTYNSKYPMSEVTKNIGTMVLNNRNAFPELNAFAQRENGEYAYWKWKVLSSDIFRFSLFLKTTPLNGCETALSKGDRIAFVTRNTYQRLVTELAVMSSGFVSVPIFSGYTDDFVLDLIKFSEVKMLILDDPSRVANLQVNNLNVVLLDTCVEKAGALSSSKSITFFCDLMKNDSLEKKEIESITRLFDQVNSDDLAMIMFTSGTTNFPKGAMLTHRNILSQQGALKTLWNSAPGMRFLCYLPWHHSFGGLFERFFALHSGGCLAVDDSWGKDTDALFRNFEKIKPHIYFSVPKVYQEIIARVLTVKKAEEVFFHKELKFVFTAAAPLPLSISDVFNKKNIPVVEGWGLTETAPCCTLTELSLGRKPGVVGFPIPGVELKLDEEGEILVRGPNVMKGYFKRPDITAEILDPAGWFKTGDIGEITPNGLKILSRKDRIFKLSNGGKVYPNDIEELVRTRCKLVKQIYIFGSGLDRPCALIFPNYDLISRQGTGSLDDHGCNLPGSLSDLAKCLRECLSAINSEMKIKSERIFAAVVIDRELSLENNELTPSFKLVPTRIEERYRKFIQNLADETFEKIPEGGFIVEVGK